MWMTESKIENQTNTIIIFTQKLNDYAWENLTEEELKNLRRLAIKIEPAAHIPAAITQLITGLSANLSQEKQKQLKIQETYAYLFNWALQEKCKGAIVFLIDPGTRKSLSLSENLEQNSKVIDRCIAENSFEVAATLIESYKNLISNEQILKFIYDAYNTIDPKKDSKEFDILLLTVLKINKLTLTQLEELAKPDPLLTFLAKYCCIETFKYVIAENINARDKNNYTPLYHAIEGGNGTLVSILEEKGAQAITFDDHYLYLKLNQYIKNNNRVGLIYLIKHCQREEILLFKDSSERFLIHYFSEKDDVDGLKLIFDIFNKFKNTKNPNLSSEIIGDLYKSNLGDYLNVLISHNTAVHIATAKKHLATLKLLLEYGADPNIPNHEGKTALHYAVKFNLYAYAEALLANNNTNPNVIADDGNTPLHYAAAANNQDMVNLLLRHNANPFIKNKNGKKPSDLADHMSNIKTSLGTREEILAQQKSTQKQSSSIFDLPFLQWSSKNSVKGQNTTIVTAEKFKELNL